MPMNEVWTRLQTVWRQASASATNLRSSTRSNLSTAAAGRRRRPWAASTSHEKRTVSNVGLEFARFGLFSIATLPFTSWVALYSYNYYYRVDLCRQSLKQQEDELALLEVSKNGDSDKNDNSMIGREAQFNEVRSLLANRPHQILVVAGPNESGKSRFVSSLLQSIDPHKQGVTYIQSAQIVDSTSTLTQAFVRAFHLQWLQLRFALVDVLPFAGSEILVMKERYSDRDLAQALDVVMEALKENARQKRRLGKNALLPVIVIDGLGEGSSWFRSQEGRQSLQQMLKWCITVTKERGLAHIILTGNEELVISLTDQNRMTRGHVHVIGLSTLETSQASPIIWQEWPDATSAEIEKLTATFGGFIHDLHVASRQIRQKLVQLKANEGSVDEERRAQIVDQVLSLRFRNQVERLMAAFASGKDESSVQDSKSEAKADDDDDKDPYLNPLKAVYSEARVRRQNLAFNENSLTPKRTASWSQLQLWRTLQRLVESSPSSHGMSVPFGDLRDDVFDGDITPLLELMNEDVLGFEIGESSTVGIGETGDTMTASQEWSWQVKPATPALGRVFTYLVHNSHLKERFQEIERIAQRKDKLAAIHNERKQLWLERQRLDMRKASLLKTAELGGALEMDKRELSSKMDKVYKSIVDEEITMEQRALELRTQRKLLLQSPTAAGTPSSTTSQGSSQSSDQAETSLPPGPFSDYRSIQQSLKDAILDTIEQEDDRVLKIRESFQKHATQSEGDGVTAADVVRLIKESTGDEIDLEVAESFIRAWDVNKNGRLDYDEFIEMLLADVNMQKRKQKRKKKSKVDKSTEN